MALAVDQLTFSEESERLGKKRQLFLPQIMIPMMHSGPA